jgi:hypothetical protein
MPLSRVKQKEQFTRLDKETGTYTLEGPSDEVEHLVRWMVSAWKKEDYRQILFPFFKNTEPGEPSYFPLISEGGWEIIVKK